MRIGSNPHKDKLQESNPYLHQVVIPVYIPNQEGYFKDSFAILKLCLASLIATTHSKTFISIVNNGSCIEVKEYLDNEHSKKNIHEIIHTHNIGKLNAIIKGVTGNDIELVTITDADVLFLPNWQYETAMVFKKMPKVGVVGIVPQFNMFKANCENMIFDKFFSDEVKFLPVKSKEGLINFYKSIGWNDDYNKDFLKFSLGLEQKETTVYIGSGHFVATYKKQLFDEVHSYFNFKLGGDSEGYLDSLHFKYDYWRVTTYDNFAFHMGNVLENWMQEVTYKNAQYQNEIVSGFVKNKPCNQAIVFIKRKIIATIIFNSSMSKWFYSFKKLPKNLLKTYNFITT
ncbi:glycosyltransferase family A protein [Flavobacterium sp. PL002]|uniref:glycosyltransferase family A protein n=1 Tax=Flavobacterium sp. PL002 TaxID=1897058 RepID=UPI001788A165|nr:glycosyltransferase family A protein [Flavobacterium sp. PL002]MBE0391137.1 hypothetical protein [Flavobacterium sp. PL002]